MSLRTNLSIPATTGRSGTNRVRGSTAPPGRDDPAALGVEWRAGRPGLCPIYFGALHHPPRGNAKVRAFSDAQARGGGMADTPGLKTAWGQWPDSGGDPDTRGFKGMG